MADKKDHGDLIIIKRYEEEEEEHHSTAWKVAHADFMTAMMAFFLIMWLINVTDSETRKAIANYFNPVDLAANISAVKGVNDPEDAVQTGTSADGKTTSSLKNTVGHESGAGDDRQQGDKERAAFQDPYAVLKRLAGEADPSPGGAPSSAAGDLGSPGTGAGDVNRDPFDPTYWRASAAQQARAARADAQRDASAPAGRDTAGSKGKDTGAAKATETAANGAAAAATPANARALESELKSALAGAINGPHTPSLSVQATSEGLVIDLTDDIDYSMFAVGSAIPDGRLVRAMEQIARVLQKRPGDVTIRGHTDGRPFRSETYDNWRLSSARAHMALYMLVRGGLDETRVVKIEGVADRNLKKPKDPNAPHNRRIEILLRAPAP
ncbi:flagellar motor protein MotB [Xanthobacter sp. V4C-4]|uniref:flagellar motor protein MotB n=1 Tax=Xanthobacter cornucopiae TaxID=3119924 RepID=UPI0037291E40